MATNKIVFLAGPTAAGKTKVAVYLAKKLNAEIISCDSMQVYKGMDIITATPPACLRKQVPHHLIGIIPPVKEYNVSEYRKEALKRIKEVLSMSKVPLFVVGTGLYSTMLIDGIFDLVAKDKGIRNRLYKEARQSGRLCLYGRLKKIDPIAAAKIHPNDTKRIVRALEVFEATGRPISELQKHRSGLCDEYEVRIFCLNVQRDELYRRVEERVDKMFKNGLLGEVKKLARLKLSRTASYAIGIRELKGYLDGLYDLEEARRLIKHNTRLYAKRQLTWFRKDKRIHWINIKDREKSVSIANRIFRELNYK